MGPSSRDLIAEKVCCLLASPMAPEFNEVRSADELLSDELVYLVLALLALLDNGIVAVRKVCDPSSAHVILILWLQLRLAVAKLVIGVYAVDWCSPPDLLRRMTTEAAQQASARVAPGARRDR